MPFKVLRHNNGKLTSVCSPVKVNYKVGVPTRSPFGGLFVFTELAHARDFASRFRKFPLAIYSCHCEDKLELPELIILEDLVCQYVEHIRYKEYECAGEVVDFIQGLWEEATGQVEDYPTGTESYRTVTLLELIEEIPAAENDNG